MKQELEFALKFMSQIVGGLILEGVIAVVLGVLIIIYPDLLGILVGLGLILGGIVAFIIAGKVHKYSRLKIKL